MVTVKRLRFAKELQHLGFTLDEVASVLADVDRGAPTCATERARFEPVLARVDEQIADLKRGRRRLAVTLDRCAVGSCLLLERSARPRRTSRPTVAK